MTRLRLRKDDPLRDMMAAIRNLPWPDKLSRDSVFPYGDFCQSVKFDTLFRRQGQFKGDFVFHYTSCETFQRLIAPDGDLLMTRFDELNDDSEFEYGWQQVMGELEWRYDIRGRKAGLFVREMMNRCAEGVRIPWIMSFSESADSLSQWGMYTDRQHGGCSVVFDFREINYITESIRRNGHCCFEVFFLPCLYSRDEIKRGLKIWSLRYMDILEEIKNLEYQEVKAHRESLICPLISDLVMLAAIIKHPGFEAEREWRLFVIPNPTPKGTPIAPPFILNGKHRYGFNMCFAAKRPLYTMKWIRGVGVSPQPTATLSDRFWKVFDAFCKAGREQWETGVWQSGIPYNGK